MALYKIPQEFKEGFKEILSLTEDDFAKLIDTLSSISPGLRHKSIHREIQSGLNHTVSVELINVIFSFGNLLYKNEGTLEDIAQNLAESAKYHFEIGKKEGLEKLATRLFKILNVSGSLKITYKASNLLTTNDKIYLDSKIISDIRVIFNDDIKEEKRFAVIVHQLKIKHQTNQEEKDVFISLDSNDLIELKNQILRAIEKEESIKKSYEASMSFINVVE